MNHLDLFTGILGFAYAAKQVWGDDYNLVACCEKDKYCQELIRKRVPGTPIFEDIRTLTKDCINEPIDLITGGFPCQPFSIAGKQKGKEDDRYLWEEMLRVITEIRPTWVVGENVTGIIKLALDDVLSSLEAEGYTTEPYIIPAASVGAPHKRDRVWIVAKNTVCKRDRGRDDESTEGKGKRLESKIQTKGSNSGYPQHAGDANFSKLHQRQVEKVPGQKGTSHAAGGYGNVAKAEIAECKFSGDSRQRRNGFANHDSFVANSDNPATERQRNNGGQILFKPEPGRFNNDYWQEHWMEVATRFCRMDDGFYNRVDRLRALGNAIVPQVAMQIFEAIKEYDRAF